MLAPTTSRVSDVADEQSEVGSSLAKRKKRRGKAKARKASKRPTAPATAPTKGAVPSAPPPIVGVARVGMRCELPILHSWGPHPGVIIAMFPDSCVVRLDQETVTSDEDRTHVVAVPWHCVSLIDIKPDLEERPTRRASRPATPSPAKCVVRAGMRVSIPTGDGNDDRAGTVAYALPECCVVKLDEKAEYAGHYSASDWSLVTPLDLGPAQSC